MEKRFDSLTIFEFGQRFPTEEACLQYLSEKKWADGFVCPVCDTNIFVVIAKNVHTTGNTQNAITSHPRHRERCSTKSSSPC
jgi:hypothetical protein